MSKNLLIDAKYSEEIRIALIEENKLLNFRIEINSKNKNLGNIYIGRVGAVIPALQAAFIEYGGARTGFLKLKDIHPDYFAKNATRATIETAVSVGQVLLVQIIREPIGNKGATVTTFLKFTGRHCIFHPNAAGRSGKLFPAGMNESNKSALRETVSAIDINVGTSLTFRNFKKTPTATQLARDYENLKRKWVNTRELFTKREIGDFIYIDDSLIGQAIRDDLDDTIDKIIIENHDAYQEAKDYTGQYMSNPESVVIEYQGKIPLFDKYNIEASVKKLFDLNAPLPSGGYLVIEQTEALVSIDVNSGRAKPKKSHEEAAVMINLEAAEEIAKQIRWRDLGGLIAIDFIDMSTLSNRIKIEEAFRKALATDDRPHGITRISQFGILEMSRKREQNELFTKITEECPTCSGTGRRRHQISEGTQVLRKIRTLASTHTKKELAIHCPPHITNYLQTPLQQAYVDEIQDEHNKIITFVTTPTDESHDIALTSQPRDAYEYATEDLSQFDPKTRKEAEAFGIKWLSKIFVRD